MPPGLVEAATALVVDGNPQPARDWLEHTQEICDELEGVFRKVGQLHDEAIFHPAPELSEGKK